MLFWESYRFYSERLTNTNVKVCERYKKTLNKFENYKERNTVDQEYIEMATEFKQMTSEIENDNMYAQENDLRWFWCLSDDTTSITRFLSWFIPGLLIFIMCGVGIIAFTVKLHQFWFLYGRVDAQDIPYSMYIYMYIYMYIKYSLCLWIYCRCVFIIGIL